MEAVSPNPVPAIVPEHVAIIMDGNGRWAKARGLPRTAGHKKGVDAVRRTVEAARDLGISHLTLFGFSSENWKRPIDEVRELMKLLKFYLRSEIAALHKNNIRLKIIGDRTRLSDDIVKLIENGETLTQGNKGLQLIIALSYGGQADITQAAKSVAHDVILGKITVDQIDQNTLAQKLSTAGIPDPDLLIRTSGEKRISNFLLWQTAYAEFVFIDTLWPEFGKEDLLTAIDAYQKRDRRYGAVGS